MSKLYLATNEDVGDKSLVEALTDKGFDDTPMSKIIDDIGLAIQNKEGTTDYIPASEMAERIANLPSGGDPYEFLNLKIKTVNPKVEVVNKMGIYKNYIASLGFRGFNINDNFNTFVNVKDSDGNARSLATSNGAFMEFNPIYLDFSASTDTIEMHNYNDYQIKNVVGNITYTCTKNPSSNTLANDLTDVSDVWSITLSNKTDNDIVVNSLKLHKRSFSGSATFNFLIGAYYFENPIALAPNESVNLTLKISLDMNA